MIALLATSAESYSCASMKEHGGTSGVHQPGLPVNTANATFPAVDRYWPLTTNPDDRRLGRDDPTKFIMVCVSEVASTR